MSFSDIILGEGDYGNTATQVEGYKDIAQNSVSYWIYDAYLGLGLTIFRDAHEGVVLAEMIKDKKDPCVVREFLEDVVLRRGAIRDIKKAIRGEVEAAYESGGEARAASIREALGIE